MIKIIKQINERQTLAEREGNYYLISQSREDIVPVEVLVFPCDKDGNVKEWLEVGGEVGVPLHQYIQRVLEEGDLIAPWRYDSPI